MRANIVRVGNSRGIIIPAAIISSCNLGETVDMQVKGNKLVIEALKQPRAGWFDGYDALSDVNVLADIPLDEDADDWQW